MKSYHSEGDENRTNLATTRQVSVDSLHTKIPVLSKRFASLHELSYLLSHDGGSQFKPVAELFEQPLGIDALEMLEAELANQGITKRPPLAGPAKVEGSMEQPAASERLLALRSANSSTIAQRASLEAITWRWRARRSGRKAHHVAFVVDLPRYVVTWAAELEAALSGSQSTIEESGESLFLRKSLFTLPQQEDKSFITKRLKYLDAIAGFILDKSNRSIHPFHRGLDVVLRVLSTAGRCRISLEDSIEPIYQFDEQDREANLDEVVVALPTTRSAFFEILNTRD